MEDEVGDLLGSPDGFLRRREVGFRVGFGWIAGCRDVGVQESGGWSEVFKGWVQAGAEVDEIAEVVHESERDVVSDQISLEVLFRALLGVEAGHIGERPGPARAHAGPFPGRRRLWRTRRVQAARRS